MIHKKGDRKNYLPTVPAHAQIAHLATHIQHSSRFKIASETEHNFESRRDSLLFYWIQFLTTLGPVMKKKNAYPHPQKNRTLYTPFIGRKVETKVWLKINMLESNKFFHRIRIQCSKNSLDPNPVVIESLLVAVEEILTHTFLEQHSSVSNFYFF